MRDEFLALARPPHLDEHCRHSHSDRCFRHTKSSRSNRGQQRHLQWRALLVVRAWPRFGPPSSSAWRPAGHARCVCWRWRARSSRPASPPQRWRPSARRRRPRSTRTWCWAGSLRRCAPRCTTAARCLASCTSTRARRRCPLVRPPPPAAALPAAAASSCRHCWQLPP